ncbi:hypothetical protein ZWY2020_010372 [Hordeum vulgare]|nr:hypothetical protein ZWY2020_010372 [Hordeum vulgare]
MSSGMGKVVCVTGASGYIASWLVKLLLHRGYTVRATVRDTADPKKTLHLQALEGAKERLHLFKASLLEEGTFDAAIAGCDCVFHTASPFYHNVKDPKKASIKRVIVTSPMAAVAYNGKPRTPDVVVDETCNGMCYPIPLPRRLHGSSKDNGLEIITINPTIVIVPLLQPTLNYSAVALFLFINGSSSTYANFCFGWVNVKDVALAHILAYEDPSANGRYCMVERFIHHSDLVKIILDVS